MKHCTQAASGRLYKEIHGIPNRIQANIELQKQSPGLEMHLNDECGVLPFQRNLNYTYHPLFVEDQH